VLASQLSRRRENRKEVLELQDTEGHELGSLQKEDAKGDELFSYHTKINRSGHENR